MQFLLPQYLALYLNEKIKRNYMNLDVASNKEYKIHEKNFHLWWINWWMNSIQTTNVYPWDYQVNKRLKNRHFKMLTSLDMQPETQAWTFSYFDIKHCFISSSSFHSIPIVWVTGANQIFHSCLPCRPLKMISLNHLIIDSHLTDTITDTVLPVQAFTTISIA